MDIEHQHTSGLRAPQRRCGWFSMARRALLLGIGTMAFVFQGRGDAVELDFFDEGMFAEGEVEIVNGKIVVKESPPKPDEKNEPDPAGDQVLELTDGSQLHGELVALTRNEVIWKRADATEPLSFTPQEVRRLTLAKSSKPRAANATIKLVGSDWLAGDLTSFAEGRFVVGIGTERPLEIVRDKVEWLALSPGLSPDTYDGPIGPMGLAGWESALEAGGGWDYADGALVAKNASPIVRQFDVLPDRVDIQFTAGDGGTNNRGLTLWLQPGNRARGYGKGSAYLRFQTNTVNANYSSGEQMKNFNANIGEEKEDRKLTRYRLLFDRRAGRLVIIINGKQVADWDLPDNAEPAANGSLSWQPSYWSSNMAWTLSNVRVQPWDGSLNPDGGENEAGKDLLSVAGDPRKAGALEGITAEAVTFAGAEISRKTPLFLRLAAKEAVEPPASAIARVWLTQRGEFDVTGIGFRDGILKVRTSFGGDLALPATTVRAIEFPHKPPLSAKPAADGGDTLVFKNGDQLRGTLVAASHSEPLRWRPIKGEKFVEFATDRLAGVLLADRVAPKPAAAEVKEGELETAVRLQNGDWLPGQLQGLDEGHLRLRSALANELRIARGAVKSIYLSSAGEAPVWDGASERDAWIKGTSVPGYWGESNVRPRRDEKRPGPWRYLDGSFTLVSSATGRPQNSGPNLGRTLQALPDKVDVSFLLSTTKGPASYSIQLFFDENKPGFMVQGGWDSAYMYDMAPRRNGAAFFNQPQQLDFGEKVGSEGNQRHFRFLGDRKAGRLWMFVNGQFVGSLSKRTGGDNPKGKGISIIPQPMLSRVTISNLWIAPWSGTLPPGVSLRGKEEPGPAAGPGPAALQAPLAPLRLAVPGAVPDTKADAVAVEPEKAVAEKEPRKDPIVPAGLDAANADIIALTNGDETIGKILKASGDSITVQCDVGELEVPLLRASLVEFAATGAAAKSGIRLRFAGKGALTVDSLRVENDRVICQSAATGELTFPLSQVTEIIYNPGAIQVAATGAGAVPGGTLIEVKAAQ
jgi:hypothetical protein